MNDLFDGVGLVTPESAEILGKAYTDGLNITYDFYMNVIGIGILCFIGFIIVYIFIKSD